MTEPAVAPVRVVAESPIRIDDLVGDVVGLGRAVDRRRRRLLARGRPTEGGRRVLVRRAADGIDLGPDAGAVQRPDPRPRVRRRRVRGRWRDRRLLGLRRRAAVPPRSRGRDARSPITPDGPWRYADLRFDAARRRLHRGPRGPLRRDGEPVERDRRDPARRRARRRASSSTGPDFLASPRLSPGRRRGWPGSSGTTRTCPGTRTRLRVAPIGAGRRRSATRDLAAGGPDESIVQPEWSPDGVLHFVSRPDAAGGTCTGSCDGPAARAAGADGGRVRRPGLDLRPLVVRVPARRLDRGGRPARRARPARPVAPGRLVGEVDSPSPSSTACGSGRRRSSRVAGSPAEPTRSLVRLDPATLAPSGVLRRSSSIALDRGDISMPEPIDVPDRRGGRIAHALFYPPTQPRPSRARRRAAAARRAIARRPDLERRRPASTSGSSC